MLATSYSQIDTFLQCPYRWYRLYLKGERKEYTAEALALGGAVHKTLETFFTARQKGEHIEVAEAKDLLKKTMDTYDIPFLSEENQTLATEQHMEMITNLAENTSHLAEFTLDKEVIACEKDFIYRMPLDFDVMWDGKIISEIYIIGSIDLILRDQNGNLIAVDFKSGKKIFDGSKLKNNLQLPIYSLVINDLYKRLPAQTLYYFTRLDTFQNVEPLSKSDQESEIIRFKTGKRAGEIKHQQKSIDSVHKELQDVFRLQYASGMDAYQSKPTPLCSWCPLGMYEDRSCSNAQQYIRKDLPLPAGIKNTHKRGNANERNRMGV